MNAATAHTPECCPACAGDVFTPRPTPDCTCKPRPGHEAPDSRGCVRHPILAALDEAATHPTDDGDAR